MKFKSVLILIALGLFALPCTAFLAATNSTAPAIDSAANNLSSDYPETHLDIPIPEDAYIPSTFQQYDVVDLTKSYPGLDETEVEITVRNRSAITIGYLQNKSKTNKKARIFVEDTCTYFVVNYLKENGPFEVQEWDFNDSVIVGETTARVPLTSELLQNHPKGTGSVGSTVNFGVSTKNKFNNKNSLSISPSISITGITYIPGSFIGFTFSIARKKSHSYVYSTTMSVSATCNAADGHSVTQYLDVGFNQVQNIKVRSLKFSDNKWSGSDWQYLSSHTDPKPRVVCIAG